ncbi:hypothetical protein ACJMK2_023191 [Sinanodonta woodiana]|uniref:HECT domain-containing protein n=1 Tax=Sinanodonta woodiana TaxID=1069815 RepID=A0ABD3T3F9_SINWO
MQGHSVETLSHALYDLELAPNNFWPNLLIDVSLRAGDSQITLEDILMFATGMKEQPYGQYPTIYFNHDSETGSKYPTSSSCFCCLYLPLHETFEEFKEAMDFGILHGSQFGQI